uniref:Endoglucanase n=1 Tax=Globodera rostochiensis TaxID=31243 RepID=A0A914I0I1_GLORO
MPISPIRGPTTDRKSEGKTGDKLAGLKSPPELTDGARRTARHFAQGAVNDVTKKKSTEIPPGGRRHHIDSAWAAEIVRDAMDEKRAEDSLIGIDPRGKQPEGVSAEESRLKEDELRRQTKEARDMAFKEFVATDTTLDKAKRRKKALLDEAKRLEEEPSPARGGGPEDDTADRPKPAWDRALELADQSGPAIGQPPTTSTADRHSSIDFRSAFAPPAVYGADGDGAVAGAVRAGDGEEEVRTTSWGSLAGRRECRETRDDRRPLRDCRHFPTRPIIPPPILSSPSFSSLTFAHSLPHMFFPLFSYAKEFFTKIAKTYGNHPNIIYEIWNEPTHQVTWEGVIKPYAETMVDLIRQYDQHSVIIVPAPNWDQDVDLVAKNPLTGYSNIAYGLHFYAGTHGEALQEKMTIAYNLGLPMFATEYGIGSTSTDTPGDLEKLEQWYAFLDSLSLSYTAWQLDDIGEESSMLTAGVSIDNICNPDFLTTYGKYIYDKLRTQNNGVESCSSITKGSSSSSSSPSSSLSATSFVSVTANIGKKWTGGHNVDLTFTNSGSEPVCSVMFSITFASAEQAMANKWNMDQVSGNEYTLPTWLNIRAGQTYRSSGFAINDKNGDPSVKVVDAKIC